MGDNFKELRPKIMDCKSRIDEVTFDLAEMSKTTDFLRLLIPRINECCSEALGLSEETACKQALESAYPALQTLEILEKSINYKNMFLNIKIFGVRLLKFLEVTALQYHDLRHPDRKTEILVHTTLVKKILPSLIQSLSDSLKKSRSQEAQRSKEFFFGLTKNALQAIINVFETPKVNERESESGLFVRTMDQIMDVNDITPESYTELQDNVEWVIKFALSVAKTSTNESDNAGNSQRVIAVLKRTLERQSRVG